MREFSFHFGSGLCVIVEAECFAKVIDMVVSSLSQKVGIVLPVFIIYCGLLVDASPVTVLSIHLTFLLSR